MTRRKHTNKMKITTDYMIGNTAVQIINTGSRIRVVDVKKEKRRRGLIRRMMVGVLLLTLLVLTSAYVVIMSNRQALLSDNVNRLKSQVNELQFDKTALEQEATEETLDYSKLMKRAQELGMDFPTKEQVYYYKTNKSTMVRMKE